MTLDCHNIIIEIAFMLIHVVGPGSRTFSHLSCCYRIAMQLSTDLVAAWRPGSALVLLLLSLAHFVQLIATDDCSQLGAATLFLCRFLSFKQLLMLHICIIYVYIDISRLYTYDYGYVYMSCHMLSLHGHFAKGWLRGWEQPNRYSSLH